MEEIWINIDGFDGCYQVSNLGKVRSVDRYVNNGDARKRGGGTGEVRLMTTVDARIHRNHPVMEMSNKSTLLYG